MIWSNWLVPLAGGGIIPTGSRVDVFQTIYGAFLVLGTLVGVVVIGYMLWKAYAYRSGSERSAKADVERPVLGELPSGGGGGRKLALSFGLSTVIVVSLIIWTYGTLLYVENSQAAEPESTSRSTSSASSSPGSSTTRTATSPTAGAARPSASP